ncbi:MAG: oligosaccharide flippase family protein [Candidatus Moranbacteria bacterium]|nr:oligosaccharide flippase family protein [Candidatus Moranbacteria bacterium]
MPETKMFSKVLKNRYIKDNFVMMAGTVIGGILGYLYHFVVSRRMSVPEYGELQSLLSAFLIFGVFNSALSYFTVRHTSVFAAHNDQTANWEFIDYLIPKVLKYAAIFFAALLVSSSIFSSALHFSNPVGFIVIGLATFISTIAVVYMEVLRGWKEFFIVSVVGVLVVAAKLISGAALVFFSPKISVVSFSIMIPSFVGWYLARRWSRKKIVVRDAQEAENWKEKYFSEMNIWKSAMNIFFFSLALVLVSNADMVLVKYFSSPETAGYYGAFALLGKIILWLNLSVVGVMLPGACAEGHGGKRPDKKNLLKSYGLMTIIALGLALAYYITPDFVINLFFGKKYIFSSQILWMFGLMSYLLSILTLEANLSFAKHDFRVVYFLAGTLFLMVAGVAKYHASLEEMVLALSVSFLLGYSSVAILNLSHEKRRLKAINPK